MIAAAPELPPLPPSPPIALPLEVLPPITTEVAEPAVFLLPLAEALALPVEDLVELLASELPLAACNTPAPLVAPAPPPPAPLPL